MSPSDGYRLFECLLENVSWQQEVIRLFDRQLQCPRLSAWYGDPGTVYQYSGIVRNPAPWPQYLSKLCCSIESRVESEFNSVLLNYYRDGNDSMGKHSDDEKELGKNPVIASLSLGNTRRFLLHPKSQSAGKPCAVNLTHGSLLIMKGNCQRNWKHAVPKTKSAVGPRINLTFRKIQT